MSQQEAARRDDTMRRACKLMASCLIMSAGNAGPLITPLAPSPSSLWDITGTLGGWGGGRWKESKKMRVGLSLSLSQLSPPKPSITTTEHRNPLS